MLAADPWQEIDELQLQSYAYRQLGGVAEKYQVISRTKAVRFQRFLWATAFTFHLTLLSFFVILNVALQAISSKRFEVSIYGNINRTRDFAAIGFLPGRISS